ncbi:hypothetical protein FACS1894121_1080 [Bacteroidia bacterium]|nr:hypothetical protein FACS1894121_1080 [Bacteroidia bacterium]
MISTNKAIETMARVFTLIEDGFVDVSMYVLICWLINERVVVDEKSDISKHAQ